MARLLYIGPLISICSLSSTAFKQLLLMLILNSIYDLLLGASSEEGLLGGSYYFSIGSTEEVLMDEEKGVCERLERMK